MSECPKCKQKISLLYLKQNCPHCNVNLRFYNFEENFYRDAKKAELSHAKINIFVAHMKASFIGSGLTKARLCVMLLPIVSLLAPYGLVSISQPFMNGNISISGLGLYTAYEDGILPYLLSMTGSPVNGSSFMLICAVLAAFLLAAVAALLIFFMTLLCFLSIKKMHKILIGTAVSGAVFSVASTILTAVFAFSGGENLLLSGKVYPGFIASLVAFGAVVAVNALIGKNGLNIVYKEGDVERVQIAKRVKAGELTIDELPQPIVETEETEEIRKAIEKQQELYRKLEEGDDHA